MVSLFLISFSTVFAVTSPFTRDLKLGDKGSDVKALQIFLNKQGFLVASKGAGSPGKETDYFGPATTKAVRAFQEEFGSRIRIPASTGIVGPSTRAFLNSTITDITVTAPVTTDTVSSSLVFTRDLEVGDTGSDVKALQIFLNKQGFLVASKGAGSPSKETTFFGPATARALKAFQESKAEVILKPSGFSSGTGYFGPSTRQVVNKLTSSETYNTNTINSPNSTITTIPNFIFGGGGGGGGGGSSGDSGGGGGGSGGSSDTSAPSIPTSVTFSAIASTSLIVSWATSTDNTAVSYYRIYRDNTLVGTSSVIYYTDTGLVGSSTYSYNVSAVDAAANASATSTTVSTSTNNDIIWWVSTTGSDSNTGHTQDTAFATFHKALTSMSGGDVLYINDGTYNDTIGAYAGQYSVGEVPTGTAQKYTRIYGYHDHSVTVDGQFVRLPLYIYKSSYVEIKGITFLHAHSPNASAANSAGPVTVDTSSYVWLHNIGAAYVDPAAVNAATIALVNSTSSIVEDSWAWGYGGRYGIMAYNGSTNIVRRNVARYDGSVDNNPKAGIAIYAEDNTIAENNIVIDFDKATDSLSDEHTPFFVTSSQSGRQTKTVSLYGNMAINTIAAIQAGFMIDNLVSGAGTITLTNNVVSTMSSSSLAGIWLSNDTPDSVDGGHHSVVLNHNTVYDSYGRGIRVDASSWSSVAINNNLIFNPNSHSTYPCYQNMGATVSGTNNMYYNCDNAYYTALPATNILNSDPQSLYLERIEAGTPGKGTASDGGDRGATIINRYVDGTLTGNVLWPFPNEDYIKQDMCNSTDSVASDPVATGTWTVYTRGHNTVGLCNTSGTISDYVWKSLGHPNPYGAPDTSAPTVPASLTFSNVTQTALRFSWASSTDDTAVDAYRVYRDGSFIGTSTSANYSDSNLTANTTYTYTVAAVDAAANISSQSSSFSTTTLQSDASAPSTPSSLTISSVTATSLNLTWASSTDNLGVTAYRLYRNDTFLATTTSANYSDSGLTSSATYTYNVAAFDAASNFSATSSTVSTSTLVDPGPEVVQGASFAFYNSSSSMTLPSSVTSGNWILLGFYVNNNNPANATISDNQGHSGATSGNFETIMATTTPGGFLSWRAVRANTTGTYTLSVDTSSGLSTTLNIVEISGSTATTTYGLINASSTAGADRFSASATSTISSPTYTNNLLLSLVNIGNTTNTFATTSAGWALSSSVPANSTSSQQILSRKPSTTGTHSMNGNISGDGAGFSQATVLNLSLTGSTLPDTTPPSVPSSLVISSVTTTSETLTWASSTDDHAVTAYRVYRNNTFLATSTSANYTDTGLSPLTSYSYNVSAVDAAANFSATSSSMASTTLADTAAPTVPGTLAFSNVTQTSLTFSWASSTDDVAVTAYRVYRNNTFLATSTAISYNDTGLSADTSYTYNVSAVDAAANMSATSSSVSTTTLPLDTTPPSVPTSLVFTNVGQNTLNVSWASSTDDVGVSAYRLYRGNTFLATTTSANYSDSGLSNNTSYSYNVSAVDAAANFSATSTTYSTTTLAVPIVIVKDTGGITHTTSSSFTFSFGSLPSQHNNIIALCSGLDPVNANVGISDNQGGTSYSSAVTMYDSNSGRWTAIRYREDISAPSGTFTLTATLSGSSEMNCTAIEVSGLALSSSLDKIATRSTLTHWGDNNATGDSTTTPTLTQSNELVVSVIGGRSDTQFTSVAASSPFTLIYNRMGANNGFTDSPAGMAYTVANSTSPVTVTWVTAASPANTRSAAGTISVATFKSQ